MRLLVSMGIRPGGRTSAPLQPRLVELDADRGAVLRELSWRSPVAHTSGPDADQELTAGCLLDPTTLLQPTHTELLWIDLERWEVVRSASHPLFHNLHSAEPRPGGGAVLTAAGLDSVLEVDDLGVPVAHHWLPDGDFAAAYPGWTDFRRAHHDAFKPHSHHPNHAAFVDGELWTTCFETKDCRSLTSGRIIALPEAIPHDGRLREGLLWFTQVDGRVVAVDPASLERRVELDLNALCDTRKMLGWCRGLDVVGSRLFVGMTMLRATTHREVLRWLVRGEAGEKLPTRVIEVDLDGPRVVRETVLGNAAGGTIYGVIARP